MTDRRLTRRRFIRDAAVTTTAAYIALDTAGSAWGGEARSIPDDLMTGVVEAVTGPRSATVSIHGRGSAHVALAQDAFIDQGFVEATSGHSAVSDLTSFYPGEKVAIRAHQSGRTLTSTEFQSIYQEMRGVVVSDDGDELQTSSGAVRLPTRVRENMGLSRLHGREHFSASVWINPATDEAIAVDFRLAQE